MVGRLEDYEARYDAATDEELASEWEPFGCDKRQRCINRHRYDQWLTCGFRGEPVFDDYRWLENGQRIEAQETIPLWKDGTMENTVECAMLPNGKWISGEHYMLSESGCACVLSIWATQYETRLEALSASMRRVIDYIRRNGKQRDKAHIADINRAMDSIRQLSLF